MYLTTRFDYEKVPFAKIWSESLVPKPKDWGEFELQDYSNEMKPRWYYNNDLFIDLHAHKVPMWISLGTYFWTG